MARVPTGVPLTKLVLSLVRLACRKVSQSTPVPLSVVGGPSDDGNPVGSSLQPCVHSMWFSSLVATSSSTAPYVSLPCLDRFCRHTPKQPERNQTGMSVRLPSAQIVRHIPRQHGTALRSTVLHS